MPDDQSLPDFQIRLKGDSMFKIYRKNCCGLDVHKTWIYACIGITDANGRTEYKESRFSSFTRGLNQLVDWLARYSCNEVCMESAGKYWIIQHILAHPGETFDVAPFVDRRCKHPIEEVQAAVDDAICREQAVKLRECLAHIDELLSHKKQIHREIMNLADKYAYPLELLRTVPGFSANSMTAVALIAEIGADMSVFPTAKHLTSWAGCCHRNDQSGGKFKSTRISRAGAYLKPLLCSGCQRSYQVGQAPGVQKPLP